MKIVMSPVHAIGAAIRRIRTGSAGQRSGSRSRQREGMSRAHADDRHVRLLRTLGVDLVLDVGANVGQFGARLRRSGYTGAIVSFEPMASAFAALGARAASDSRWTALNMGLGDRSGPALLHVAGNSGSSSLLEMLPAHLSAAPGSAYVGTEAVQIRRLDELADELLGAYRFPCLKVDTQGFELAVMRGAGDHLGRMAMLRLELLLVPLYTRAPLYDEVMRFVGDAGFALAGVEPGFADRQSGQLLAMDGLFVRTDLLPIPMSDQG
jgi:FkbM family methyltransferase